jgi:tetratricopeptide (TPR) repeat protein
MKTEQVRNCRPRLSVAIIARNEQEVITGTLDSVRAIADEIIVWDSGSEDDTISLARKKGAKVFQGFWKNNFSAARNECLEKVAGDWVLWLDAGEKLDDKTAEKLREFIDSSTDPRKAYQLMVEISPADNFTAGEQIAQPRLLPVKAGLKFEGRVRETLHPSIKAAGLEIETAPGRILRHSRQHSQDRKIRLANRDLGLVELELINNENPEPRLFLVQGEAYVNSGDYDRAREVFIKAIDLAESGSIEMLEGYYGLLTGYNGDPNLRDAQMRVCLSALEVFPKDAQLLLAIGSYFQSHNRLDLASRAFETAVKYGQINTSIWHLCGLPEVAASCLVMTLQLLGKDEEACKVLETALARNPQSPRLLRLATDIYIKNGKAALAIETAQRNGTVSGKDDPHILAIRGASKAAKQEWTPALAYLQSAYLLGCRDILCLRWLAVTLLSTGQAESVRPVLAEWQKLEPKNPELLAYLAAVREPCTESGINAEQEPGNVKSTDRQYRVDSGKPATDVALIQIPVVHDLISSERAILEET